MRTTFGPEGIRPDVILPQVVISMEYNKKSDYFAITEPHKVFYSYYPVAICQWLHFSIN